MKLKNIVGLLFSLLLLTIDGAYAVAEASNQQQVESCCIDSSNLSIDEYAYSFSVTTVTSNECCTIHQQDRISQFEMNEGFIDCQGKHWMLFAEIHYKSISSRQPARINRLLKHLIGTDCYQSAELRRENLRLNYRSC